MTSPAPLRQPFGRYELLSLLARGGMAEVFLARMTGVGGFARQLVIKRILPQLVDDPEFVTMFLDEGRIAARLTHPNVCQVHELGEVGGSLFLAMEYLEGLTWAELAPLIPRDGTLELACAAGVIGQICLALRYAHELRDVDGTATPIVHRDVSPQNMMVTSDGVCKLLDFGVSKVLTEGSRTRTGVLKGKLPYMAPEQIRGEPVGPQADVFALGVVLWEALTGARLFRRDTDYQIWRAVTEEAIPAVTSRAPRLPAAVDAVVGRALERDLDRRYPTIAEFASDLRHTADRVGGPLDQPALADVVRTLGAARLARRAQKVHEALGRPDPARALSPVATVAEADGAAPPPAVTEPGITHSVQLRDGSVQIGRRARRTWPWLALGASAALGAGLATAFWVTEHDPLATVTRAAAPGGDAADHAGDVPPAEAAAPPTRAAAASPAVPPTGGRGDATAPPPSATSHAAAAHTDNDGGHADARAPEAAMSGEHGARPRPRRVAATQRPASPPPAAAKRPASPPPATSGPPGQYSVDSTPYATIFIDGRSYGETPLFKIALPPGKHQLRAVRMDGRVQQHTITIEPGKLTSSGTLAW